MATTTQNISLTSGNCNANPLDSSCYCIGSAGSANYKIFDVASGEYVCCGLVGLSSTSASGGGNPTQNITLSQALDDDTRCIGWWSGPNNINFPNPLPSGLTIPVAGQDWYLPNVAVKNGLMPPSYGPTTSDLANLTLQGSINQNITLPTNTINSNGAGTTASCTYSSGNVQTYWLRYYNPNIGSLTAFTNASSSAAYVDTLVCADQGVLKASPAYSAANFALFNVNCSSVTNTGGVYSCIFNNGEASYPNNIGNLVLSSTLYKGGSNGNASSNTTFFSSPWVIGAIVLGVVIIIIILIIFVHETGKRKKKRINQAYTEGSAYTQESYDPGSDIPESNGG